MQCQITVTGIERAEFHGPTQQCPDSRHHLVHRERLGKVIVGSSVETFHAVMQGISRRQHEARNTNAGISQPLQQDEPVPVWQPSIKNQGLVGHLLNSRPRGVDAVGHIDADSCGYQAFVYKPGHPLMVFDQEYSAHQKLYL